MSDTLSLENWIDHVFDHPVTDPAWHWALDAPEWVDTPEHIAWLIAETFEQSGELLSRFSDAQLNQAFWFMVSNSCSNFMFSLIDPGVPFATRLRALYSFVPLFERVMATRCSPHLSHLNEQPSTPLNGACYMWWDILPIYGKPDEQDRVEFDAEVLRVLERLLAIPHDACRESALHGLGHWQIYYPQVADIVDAFLSQIPHLRPELIAYAQNARVGYVQ